MDHPQRAIDYLKEKMEGWRVSLFGDRLHVIVDGEDIDETTYELQAELAAAGVRVLRSRNVQFSLEDVFISVVEQARRQGLVAAEG